ncbi:trehalose-phosphatase [Pseudonocardia sp. NPDC046786]|uniref:trehalose-phosphatase n=1 Tax=Pseudonocardia sp. NPDC046786 TaxID=3155471 RepID=UPI0033D938B6
MNAPGDEAGSVVVPHTDAFEQTAERIRTDPRRCAFFLDFDGVLAPIQDDPGLSRPLPELVGQLRRIASTVGRLCIVSGRPVSFLESVLPELDCDLYGAYGMQWRVDGVVGSHPSVARHASTLAAAVAAARDVFPDLVIEDKGVSMTVHYRTRPTAQEPVERWASERAVRSGLRLLTGRMVVELAMPVEGDKGDVVRAGIAEVAAAVYVGDDVGDLPAFRAIHDEVARRPDFDGLAVAVLNDAAVPELVALSHVRVDSPHELTELLTRLVGGHDAQDSRSPHTWERPCNSA